MNKIKYIFSIIALLCLPLLFTVTANAYSENVDIKKEQPFMIIEGEDIDIATIVDNLTYGEIKEGTDFKVNSVSITYKSITNISHSLTNKSPNDTTKISTTNLGLSSENQSIVGKIQISYRNPSTATNDNAEINLLILHNSYPVVTAPHIYISSAQYDEFKTITDISKKHFQFYVLDQISILDGDGSVFYKEPKETGATSFADYFAYDIELISMDGSAINISNYEKGTTVQFCITVTDINKAVTIPCYITFLNDENLYTENHNTYTRSISKDYFPYYRSDIKTDNGFYYAVKQNGVYYFVNNENKLLKNDKGEPYPVDACLTNLIIPLGATPEIPEGEICKVVPISKWIKNGNCMALLSSCLIPTDEELEQSIAEKNYVASWTFPADEVKLIQDMLKDGKDDPNFYLNYLTNGYCEEGNRVINGAGKIAPEDSLGDNTGLNWYISNNTLYIVANEIANESYTYAIPDYNPSTKISTLANNLYKEDGGKFYDVTTYFVKSGAADRTDSNTPPWHIYALNGSFNKVVFDNKITRIGAYAFYGYNNITEPIEIPTNCSTIGEAAFMNCINLTGGIKTGYVHEIEPFAFANCREMKGQIFFGDKALNKIGTGAFYNSGFTKSLTIPSSVTSIGAYAFTNCTNLSGSLKLGENISEIGAYAFTNCISLDGNLQIPNSLKEIKDYTFAGCISLNGDLTLGNSLTKIGNYAFYNCYNLAGNIILPENLTTIGTGTFKNCQNLKNELVLNAKIQSIGAEAFAGCINIIVINNNALADNKTIVIAPRAFYTNNDITTTLTKVYKTSDNTQKTTFAEYNFMGDHRYIANY